MLFENYAIKLQENTYMIITLKKKRHIHEITSISSVIRVAD